MEPIIKKKQGGSRPGSGRPVKMDKDQWGKITCVLRKDTIEKLKSGAASKHFGDFLQWHLDRYPLPKREVYLALLNREPVTMRIKGKPAKVLMSTGSYGSVRLRKPRMTRRPMTSKEFEDAIAAA